MKSNIYGESNDNSHRQQRTGYNPITGTAYDDAPQHQQQHVQQQVQQAPVQQQQQNQQDDQGKSRSDVHTSSRVLQPPGGRSNGPLW